MNILKKQVSPIIGTIILIVGVTISISAITVNILISSPAGLSSRTTTTAGKIYYVNPSGNDSNNGLSQAAAWKTIAKVNAMMSNLQPGDQVLFKAGSKWNEQLRVTKSGILGNPIIFDSYGTGAKPIISGNNSSSPDSAGISLNNVSNIYIRNLNIDSTGANSIAGLLAYNTNGVVISKVTISNSFGFGGIYFLSDTNGKGQNNIILNCTVYGTKGTVRSIAAGNYGTGIFLYSPDGTGYIKNNQIGSNEVYNNGQGGILVQNGISNSVTANKIYNNDEGGINIAGFISTNNKIQLNTVYNNTQIFDDRCGINLYRVGSNNQVTRNTVHDQYDTFINKDGHDIIKDPTDGGAVLGSCGIRFDGGSDGITNTTNNIVAYNIVYNEVDGVQIYDYSNTKVLNNVVYNSTRFGILLAGKSGTSYNANNWAKNNIIHTLALGDTSSHYKKLLEMLFPVNNVVDYNIYYPNGTLIAGQDAHSILADPVFMVLYPQDPQYHVFKPRSTSPAINAGTSVGLSGDFVNTAVPQGSAVDIGAYEQ